jgi:hypothetical protein
MNAKKLYRRMLPRSHSSGLERRSRFPKLRNFLHRLKRAVGLVAILALPLAAQDRPTRIRQVGSFVVTPGTGTFPISGEVSCTNCGGQASGAGSNGANVTSTFTVVTATGAGAASFLPVKLVNTLGAFYDAGGSGGGNSGSYTVTPGTGTFPVSGAFWQAVQAVSQSGVWNVGATLAAETTKVIGTVNIAAGQTIGVTGPLTDSQLRASAVPMSAASLPLPAGAATESTLSAVRTAVEKSSTVLQGSNGAAITATGTSLNVNCTGGCGAPSQAGTFIAHSSITLAANAYVQTLCNKAGSTVVLKIMSMHMFSTTEAAVTGLVTSYSLRRMATATGGTVKTADIIKADNSDSALNANVELMVTATGTTGLSSALGGVSLSSEETAVQANEKYIYRYWGIGEKPITLRVGECIGVRQSALTAAAGTVGVRTIFTQE